MSNYQKLLQELRDAQAMKE